MRTPTDGSSTSPTRSTVRNSPIIASERSRKRRISWPSCAFNSQLRQAKTGSTPAATVAKGRGFILHTCYYPGLSKKTKDKLPLAKSKTARSTARPPLLGWRCALVRILVFSFHLLSSSRRWLRWIDSGFLSEGFSVQARPVVDPLLQCSFFSFSSEDLEKFEVCPQSGGRRV